jgi:hypothetical protein
MPVPSPALSNVAVASGPATSDTPVGVPEVPLVLNPLSTAVLVPSATFCAVGNSNMRSVIAAPSVSTNSVVKSVGVVYETGL